MVTLLITVDLFTLFVTLVTLFVMLFTTVVCCWRVRGGRGYSPR
jgi:hypothetical protein